MLETTKALLLAIAFLFVGVVCTGIAFVSVGDYRFLLGNLYVLFGIFLIGIFYLGMGLYLTYSTVVEIKADPDEIIF